MPNYRLKAHMIEAVDKQLRDNDPKAVKDTFGRLIQLGYGEKKAKEMIAAVLIEEMYYILKNKETFNEERYVGKLSMLPEYLLEKTEDGETSDIDNIEDEEDMEETVSLPIRKEKTPGRNDLCPCGSNKKYKKCCGK